MSLLLHCLSVPSTSKSDRFANESKVKQDCSVHFARRLFVVLYQSHQCQKVDLGVQNVIKAL